MEVTIEGVDDNTPVFAPNTYTATVYEDAKSTQSVVRVSATDADLGDHGKIYYQIDPANAVANNHFSIVPITNDVAEIQCRGALDIETLFSTITFKVGNKIAT